MKVQYVCSQNSTRFMGEINLIEPYKSSYKAIRFHKSRPYKAYDIVYVCLINMTLKNVVSCCKSTALRCLRGALNCSTIIPRDLLQRQSIEGFKGGPLIKCTLLRGLKGVDWAHWSIDWSPIMPRDASLSSSGFNIFESGMYALQTSRSKMWAAQAQDIVFSCVPCMIVCVLFKHGDQKW